MGEVSLVLVLGFYTIIFDRALCTTGVRRAIEADRKDLAAKQSNKCAIFIVQRCLKT
jgi:hypothetical protein